MASDDVEILLVEDNADDMELTLHALRKEKLCNRIEVARDGEEALDFLFCRGRHAQRNFNLQPHLVLLDLKLPKVDGLEVLHAVKADARLKSLPVVVLTASREERDMVESYKLGVNSYIQKPVDFEQFRESIRTVGLYWLVVNQPPPSKLFPSLEGAIDDGKAWPGKAQHGLRVCLARLAPGGPAHGRRTLSSSTRASRIRPDGGHRGDARGVLAEVGLEHV